MTIGNLLIYLNFVDVTLVNLLLSTTRISEITFTEQTSTCFYSSFGDMLSLISSLVFMKDRYEAKS